MTPSNYDWNWCEPETFVNLKTTEPDNPLENSHRISQAVRDYLDKVAVLLEMLPGRLTWVPNEKRGSANSGYRGVVSEPGQEKYGLFKNFQRPSLRKVEQDYKASVANDEEAAAQFLEEGVDYLKKLLFDNKIYLNDADIVFKKAADILTDGN